MSALRAVDSELMRAAITLEALKGRTTVSVTEAAAVLGIGKNAAYDAVHAGTIPSLSFGSRIVVPVVPLLKLIGIEL